MEKFSANHFSVGYTIHNTVNLAAFSGSPVFQKPGDLFEWLSTPDRAPLNCEGSSTELAKLEYLYYEKKSLRSRRGDAAFFIGFPIILLALPGREKASLPLFFWEIDLKRNPEYFSEWQLSAGEKKEPLVNPQLVDYFRRISGNRIDALLQDFKGGKFPAQSGLDAFYRRLKVLMPDLELPSRSDVLSLWPHSAAPEHLLADLSIGSIAVFGFFPYLNIPPIVSTREIPKKDLNTKIPGSSFYALPADPYQRGVLDEAGKGGALLEVTGGPGTGKTHTLVNLALNALSDKKNCLIVAPGVAGLREIQELMAVRGLDTLQFMLVNTANEAGNFKQFLKGRLEQTTSGKPSREVQHWENELRLYKQNTKVLDERLKAIRSNVFGQLTWPELAGLYLKSNQDGGKEYLDSLVSGRDFQFDESTYLRLKKSVVTAELLYTGLHKLKSPLSGLATKIFLNKSKQDAADFVQSVCRDFSKRFIQLQQDFALLLADYKDALFAFYQELFVEMKERAATLEKDIAGGLLVYGDYFLKAADGPLQLRGLLGGKYAALAKEKQYLINAWNELIRSFRKSPLIHEGFSTLREHQRIGDIQKSLKMFIGELMVWQTKLPGLTEQECSRLSAKTIKAELGFLPRLEKLEAKLQATLKDFNASDLFEEDSENLMLSVVRMLDFLEEGIASIEAIAAEMPFFDPFFDWQRFWLGLEDGAREIIQALIRSKAPDWEKSFNSWFFYHVLAKNSSADLPRETPDFASCVSRLDSLRDRFPEFLSQTWNRVGATIPKSEKKHLTSVRDKKQANEKETISAQWFDENFSAISSIVPVLLLSQSAAAELLPGLSKTFDLVLVDNAGFLDDGMLDLLAPVGKQQVHFFQSGNRETSFKLNICHRWPPGFMDFLVDPVIRLSEDSIGEFKVVLQQTDGRYDENNRVNEAEAAQVLQILNEIEETPGRTLPRVVIAGFTKEQRNLLASYIDRIKLAELPGAEKIRQLERNGLQIVYPGDLPGVHADILLVSLTFGPVNIKGDLPEAIQELNDPNTLRELRLLSGRVGKELFIVNSIPEHLFDMNNLSQSKESGKGFAYLMHYLAYAKSLSCQDSEQQGEVVASLNRSFFAERQDPNIRRVGEGAMYERIAEFLKNHFPAERVIRNYRSGQFDFPLVLLGDSPAEKLQVVLLDGFWSPQPVTDMEWEFKQGKLMAAYKIKVVWTFAVNWFLQPEKAGEKLIEALGSGQFSVE